VRLERGANATGRAAHWAGCRTDAYALGERAAVLADFTKRWLDPIPHSRAALRG
jgi:hypothetical protein